MSIPKRHHYVPRFILANFVDDAGKLWAGWVGGGPVWSAAPDEVYVERHLYTSIDAAGNRDTELEQAYSVLEGMAKPLVDRFLANGRSGAAPLVTDAEKAVWDEFLFHQMKRVPAMLSALEKKQNWAERLEAVIDKLRERGVYVDEKILTELRSPVGLERLKKNATVKALSADSPLVRILLGAANIELGVAPAGTCFAISSHPIAGIRAGLQSVRSGASEMWLPIASDVAVRVAFGGENRTMTLAQSKIESINRDSLGQGDYLAGASQSLIESLIRS